MGPVEMIFVNSKKVSCDGVKSLSNHPVVYLNMGDKDFVVCPYCSKYFTTKKAPDKISTLKEILHKNS
jgi:uncharacterized Zn-finger protein